MSMTLTRADTLRAFIDIVGEAHALVLQDDIKPYLTENRGLYHGSSPLVLKPASTAEVSAILKLASATGTPIVPVSGGTGLVGGQVPREGSDDVLLSLERMNRIREVDALADVIIVDGGCVLASVQKAAEEHDRLFPLSLGSEGSCRIGGNLSTNAGGTAVLAYGNMRQLCLGLEVVLPTGEIWDGLRRLKKDNSGYDLRDLFIGAEGTLGIITAVSIKLMPFPDQVATALLGLNSLDDAITLYRRARRDCCDLMSAFEFMPPLAFVLAREAIPDLAMPIAGDYPAYVLMEISGSGLVDIADLMERFLGGVMEDGLVVDGVIAASQAQARNLWLFREGMNEGQAKRGQHMRTDISVPLSRLADFVRDAEQAVSEALPDCTSVSYGHVGDGNVHLNVLPPAGSSPAEIAAKIYEAKTVVNRVLDEYHGSISAEHGIGRLKRADFEERLDPSHRALLSALKQAIDPSMVMNPGCQLNFPGIS